ncbi:MAG: type II toxin-antitoxin system HicA family toxin [Ignavibacterium sp.]
MPKLKVLSGDEIIKIFKEFDFSVTSQKGGHIKISRIKDGEKQVLVFPNHKEIDTGTLKAIYRQALKYIPESEIKKYFYHD